MKLTDADHRRVLACGPDVPEQTPGVKLPLNAVGISNKTAWVTLPEGVLPFDAVVEVDLPSSRRGIHMSRIEEVLSRLHEKPFPGLGPYAARLAREVVEGQGSAFGRVALSGKIPLPRATQVSHKVSLDSLDLLAEAEFVREQDLPRVMLGVRAHHITACPCTQVYNQVLFERHDPAPPLPTHSQRSLTTLWVEQSDGYPDWRDLLACLEAALHLTSDLLKRPDEAELVLASHLRPQFIEDAVRDCAAAARERFGGSMPGESRVVIEAVSLESIHVHDVHCRLCLTMDELAAWTTQS